MSSLLPVDFDDLSRVLADAADAVAAVLDQTTDWDINDPTRGQYRVDVAADAAAVPLLAAAGLGVLSEESGRQGDERPLTAVIDPLDGSTNAAQGIAWFATSICVVDEHGPLIALVADQAHGDRFTAVRGGGALRNGDPIEPASDTSLDQAIVGLSDLPPERLGWNQFRTFGALALDLCAVADGRLDGYLDCGAEAHGAWDYLGGLLICHEAGALVEDAHDRDLITLAHGDRRTPVAACGPGLLAECRQARATFR